MAEQVSIELITDISKSLKTMEQFALAAKKKSDEASDSFTKFSKVAIASVAAAFSVNKIVSFLEDSVKAAAEAEEANQKLAASLQLSGRFASDAATNLDEFAKSVQNATVFEDDFIKSNIAVLVATTKLTEEGLKQATIAATNLAAGLKIDLGTAFDIVGKAANGNIATLNRNNVKVREGANAAETFSNALAGISAAFGTSAGGQLQTYAGKIAQLNNFYGDLKESIGNVIIQNAKINESLALAAASVKNLTVQVDGNKSSLDRFITGLFNIGEGAFKLASYIPIVIEFQAAMRKLFDVVARLGDVKFEASFAGLAKGLKGTVDAFLGIDKIAKPKGFGDLKVIEARELDAQLKELKDKTGDAAKVVGKLLSGGVAEMSKELPAEIKKIQEALKTAGKTEIEIAKFIFDSQKKVIKDAASYKLINGVETNKLLLENEAQFQKKSLELAAKAAEERKKLIQGVSSFDSASLAQFASGKNADGSAQSEQQSQDGGAALALGGVQKALTGTQGVLDIFSGVLGAALGPLGSIASGILSVLAKGPEAAAGFVTEFIKSIPLIITNIIEAIPMIITAFIELLPDLIVQFVELLIVKIPELIAKLAEMLPELINQLQIALIQKLPEIITNLVQGFVARMPEIVTGFTTEFAKQAPVLAVKFAVAFVKEVPNIVKALIDGIVDSIKSLGGLLGGGGGEGGGGGIGGAISSFVSNPIGTIGDFLGFAEGGIVPPGFNKDNFPMRATSGELIIDRSQNKQLQEFLDGAGQGGGGLTQVNIQVGEQQLASVMLNLSRGGYRTAV